MRTGTSRVAVVTGATDGIGRAVAIRLATQGFRVLAVGRNRERGESVIAELTAAGPSLPYATPHRFHPADLASMAGTAALAEAVGAEADRVDALVCCAGIFALRPGWTDEGFERTFALNYLSRFLLVRRFEPSLRRASSARVVLVANAGKYRDTLDLDDPHYRRGRPGIRVSARTQFANDLLAVELVERYRGTSGAATSVFPGVVRTDMFRHGTGVPRPLAAVMGAVARRTGLRPEAPADTPARLVDSAGSREVSASFFGPHRSVRGIPERVNRPDRRAQLWAVSERLTAPWLAGIPADR